MSGSQVFSVAVTSTEWRHLLGHSELRLARRRVQQVSILLTTKERDRLFGWEPTTVLGDDNDTIVLELADDWLSTSQKVAAHPSELVVLSLTQVAAHHCVSSTSRSYFAGDADRVGVQLLDDRYGPPWSEWVRNQQAALDQSAIEELLATVNIALDFKKKRKDGYRWSEIVQLSRYSKSVIKPRPKHVESLLRSIRGISTAVAGVHANAAFDLAVNIEWIQARTGKNPLKARAVRDQLGAALTQAKTIPWSSDLSNCNPVSDGLALLITTFPKAYTDELTPETVAKVVRTVAAAKDRTLKPLDVVESVGRLVATNESSAALLLVAVCGALGATITRRLTKSLQSIAPLDLDWSGS